jgi:hypothetical protein
MSDYKLLTGIYTQERKSNRRKQRASRGGSQVVSLTNHCKGDKIEEDKTAGLCRWFGGEELQNLGWNILRKETY